MPDEIHQLHELAGLYGVETGYDDIYGRRIQSPPDAIVQVLRSLGAPLERMADLKEAIRARSSTCARRIIDPVTVVWDGEPTTIVLQIPVSGSGDILTCRLELENGKICRWRQDLSELPAVGRYEVEGVAYRRLQLLLSHRLPPGYHSLQLDCGRMTAAILLISAPRVAYGDGGTRVRGRRRWGLFAPVYALHSQHSWGSGDFSDWKQLLRVIGELGGSVAGTLPLLASVSCDSESASPYSPSSRQFWNEVFIDITRIPELDDSPRARALLASPEVRREIASLRAMPLCDHKRRALLMRRVLTELSRTFWNKASPRREAFGRYLNTHPGIESFARYRAWCDRMSTPWRQWASPQKDGHIRNEDCDPAAVRYHLYVQWLADDQLRDVADKQGSNGVGLYLDFPLGVHPDGYDVWHRQGLFVSGMSLGAPPDDFFSAGQDWGSPPLHPERIGEEHFRYLVACLRHHLEPAAMLRVDHVMGLHRLFWVPTGTGPTDGVYVRQPWQALYAILSLESHRHRTVLVGEDLGTVPAEVRTAMARHGMRRMYVLQTDLKPDPRAPLSDIEPGMVAALNTHDMPTFAGFWEGSDITKRREMGLLDDAGELQARAERKQQFEALTAYLRERGLLGAPSDLMAIYRGCLQLLTESRADLVMINLEDLWLERMPQNVPGTVSEYPNWRRKLHYSLEALRESPEILESLPNA